MSDQQTWYEEDLQRVTTFAAAHPGVAALLVSGSVAAWYADPWSDLDLLAVVDGKTFDLSAPALDWLASLGEIYGYEFHHDEFRALTRACLTNGHRIDLVLTTEAALARYREWGATVPSSDRNRVLFSRSPVLDTVLSLRTPVPPPRPVSKTEFDATEARFWYWGMMAVYKVVRNDLLIALHLNLEMVQDCCVLAMLLRDRATGTAHHSDGGIGNRFVAGLDALPVSCSKEGILASIEETSCTFDRLASEWTGMRQPRRGPLLDAVQRARGILDPSGSP